MNSNNTNIQNSEDFKMNPETLSAIEEVEKMKTDSSIGKIYDSVSNLLQDLDD